MPDRELLSLAALALYRADIWWYLCTLAMEQEPIWIPICIDLWLTPGDPSVKVSMNRTTRYAIETISRMPPTHEHFGPCSGWMAHASYVHAVATSGNLVINVFDRSGTLAALCNCLLQARIDFKMQRMYIAMALEMMFRFVRPMPVIIYPSFWHPDAALTPPLRNTFERSRERRNVCLLSQLRRSHSSSR